MNKWKIVLLFSLAVNVAVAVTLVYFWDRYDGMQRFPALLQRPDRNARPLRPLWRSMALDAAQKQELARLRLPFDRKIDRLRFELDRNRRHLMDTMLSQPAAQDSIKILVQRLAVIQTELDASTVDHLLTMRPFLNDRQWRILLTAFARENREPRAMNSRMH